MQKEIRTVCLKCGNKYKKTSKTTFGVWKADCDLCEEKNVFCADALHDFGMDPYFKSYVKERTI